MRNSQSPQKPYENAISESQSTNPSPSVNSILSIPKRDSSVTLNYSNSLGRGSYRGYGDYGNGYNSGSYGSYGNRSYGYGGSSYGNSYGYGSYGNRSYGNSYGCGSYGNRMGGYNRNYGNRVDPEKPGDGVVDHTMHWINKIQNTTDVLAQFTGLIVMNAEAIYTSYSSFIGLLEGFSHLGYILSGFTFLRWLIGKKREANKPLEQLQTSNPLANEFALAKKSTQRQWTSVFVIVGLFVIGLPLMSFLYKKMQELVEDEELVQSGTEQWKPKIAIAIADYRAAGPDDIEFAKGDQILVISKPFDEWWEGEVYSRGQGPLQRGLFPYNFIEFVQQPQQGVG
jgi:hypothetical protein